MENPRIDLAPRPHFLFYQPLDVVSGLVILENKATPSLDTARIVFRGQSSIGIESTKSRTNVDTHVTRFFETSQTLYACQGRVRLPSNVHKWAFEFTFPRASSTAEDDTQLGQPLPPSLRLSSTMWKWNKGETSEYTGEVMISYELIVYFKPSAMAAEQQVASIKLPFCPCRNVDIPDPLFALRSYPFTSYTDGGRARLKRTMKSLFNGDPSPRCRFNVTMHLPRQVADYEPVPLFMGVEYDSDPSAPPFRPPIFLRELVLEFEREVALPFTKHEWTVADKHDYAATRRVVERALVFTELYSIPVNLSKLDIVLRKRSDLRKALPPGSLLLTCIPSPTFQDKDVTQKYGLKVKFAIECERRMFSGEIDDRSAELVVLSMFQNLRHETPSGAELSDETQMPVYELDSSPPLHELPGSQTWSYELQSSPIHELSALSRAETEGEMTWFDVPKRMHTF